MSVSVEKTVRSKIADEISFFARDSKERNTPLFLLVLYRSEADRRKLVGELEDALSKASVRTVRLDLSDADVAEDKLYSRLGDLPKDSVGVVERLAQEKGGLRLDSDYLRYLNIHRDRMAAQRLRWVLFLHEADVEQFQSEAGDLWDFRQHTFWLDGEPAEPREMVWLNVERSMDGYGSEEPRLIETSREEIDEHCRRVRSQVEETEDEEEQAALLGDLAGWLLRRGAYEPAVAVVREALRTVPESARSRRAELEGLAGRALEGAGDLKAAVQHIRRQIEFLNAEGDHRAEARAWIRLGAVKRAGGYFEEAQEALERSLEISEAVGALRTQAQAYFDLGALYELRGPLAKAGDHYQKVLERAEGLQDQSMMATASHQLGILNQKRGSYDEALEWYRKSLAIDEELGNRAGMADSYHQLGVVAQKRGSYDEALEWYRKSLAIQAELGNQAGMASSYHQLGMVAQQRGSYDEALEWYHKSLAIKEKLGNRAGMASSYHQLGMVAEQRGSYDEALEWYRRSLAIQEKLGKRAGMASTISQVGVLATKQGQAEEAVPLNLQSLAIRLEIGSVEARIDLHWLRHQREELGEDRFVELVTQHVGEDGTARVLEILDEYGAASETSEE